MAIRTHISIITLNVNGIMPQPKDIDWLNGYKNKIHICAILKRPTSLQGTHTNWKWEDGRKYSTQKGNKIRLEEQYSDKIEFKMKNILRDKEGHYLMI